MNSVPLLVETVKCYIEHCESFGIEPSLFVYGGAHRNLLNVTIPIFLFFTIFTNKFHCIGWYRYYGGVGSNGKVEIKIKRHPLRFPFFSFLCYLLPIVCYSFVFLWWYQYYGGVGKLEIIRHHLGFPFLLQSSKVQGRLSPLKMISK